MNFTKKLALLLLLLLAAAAIAWSAGEVLSFERLKASQALLVEWRAQHPMVLAGLFFGVYLVLVALSVPGALVLTLAAGAVFGFWWGLVLVSFASTLGATLAFWASRFVLRDWVERRFGQRLQRIHHGLEKDGAFYLLTLRLIPLFPFFLINLAMGLTRIRTLTFYGVSQLGMLAGTAVVVNAGTQLARLDSAQDVWSPGLLGGFALLGVFPLVARWGVAAWQRHRGKRRAFAPWASQRPRSFDRNLIVIGAGAGGLVSAYIAAALKAKVTLLEAHKMGGDCLNYGCVPSKALIQSAKLAHHMRHASRWGLHDTEPALDFKAVMQRVQAVVQAIEPHDSAERYRGLGVEVIPAYGKLVNPWTVELHEVGADPAAQRASQPRRLTARSIVIATGASPLVPELPGLAELGYVTSDTLWQTFAQLDAAPPRLVVLGGGPIGCELAQCFARLGSHVTLVEMGPRLLAREDPEVSALASSALQADGVRVLTEHRALRCERVGGEKTLVLAHEAGDVTGESAETRIAYDELVCAVGRVPRLQGYGLQELGIPTQRTVSTNEYLQTLYPNIYAVGDVAGPWQFTHTAAHQAWYATVNALLGEFKLFKVDDSVIPRTTFIDPEVARVGLNEQEAMEKNIPHEITRYNIEELDRAITDGLAQGFVKVLTVPGKDRILGVTIVGAQAGELLAEYALAMKHGLGLNALLSTPHAYPTLAEANKHAAGAWKRAHAPQRLLAWLARYHQFKRGSTP